MKQNWILRDFAAALGELETALEQAADSELIKAGCIQYFEFCFELAWKSIKVIGNDQGEECFSPKSCLKLAFRQGWSNAESVWLEMLDARNRMSHTYDAQSALDVYSKLPEFLQHMKRLQPRLRHLGE